MPDIAAQTDIEHQTDRNLALELVRVTESAALAASRWMGLGKKNEADGAAVEGMRRAFDAVAIDGTVVIGEGEMDEAPMLFIGEKVGSGGPRMDIAVDPLEGTTVTAKGGANAIAVVALAESGNFLHAPDIYMSKIAVGSGLPAGVIDIDDRPERNLRNLARAKRCDIADLVVCILDRDRHEELIADVRQAGARIMLIDQGDVAAVIATATPDSGIDMYMGSGGAPEGVLAAAALRCIGGQMQGRLLYEDDEQRERAKSDGRQRPEPGLRGGRHGARQRHVRRHRRHVRPAAARCAAVRQRGGDAFDGDAEPVRHGADHRGSAQFQHQDLDPGVAPLGLASCPKWKVPSSGGGADTRNGVARLPGCRYDVAPRRRFV